MNTFSVELIEKIRRTPSIESFRFKTESRIDFLPGQFLKVIFDPEIPGNKELNKFLSFSASPTKDYIEVTKRLSESAFTEKLKALQIGEGILMQGPMGNCIYRGEYTKIGFLIGGIGITPVVSILEYIKDKNMDIDIVLVYSSKTNAEIAFRSEINSWKNASFNMQVFYTVTDCMLEDGACMKGHISKDMIRDRIKDLDSRKFFIFGPPVMVQVMKQLCVEFGCNENDVMAENFVGY